MPKPYKILERKMGYVRYPSRTEVQSVSCPRCGSSRGEPCIGARQKIRESNHMERIYRYMGIDVTNISAKGKRNRPSRR